LAEEENDSFPKIISTEEKEIKKQKPPNNKILQFNLVEEDKEQD